MYDPAGGEDAGIVNRRMTSMDSRALALVQIKGALEPKLRRVTALMLAAASGSQETVRLLMESGASVDAVSACVCFVGGFRQTIAIDETMPCFSLT